MPGRQNGLAAVRLAGSRFLGPANVTDVRSMLTDEEITQVTKAVVEHVDHRAFVVAPANIAPYRRRAWSASPIWWWPSPVCRTTRACTGL